MAERITQLQDLINQQADHIWQSLLVIEKFSNAFTFHDLRNKKYEYESERKRVKREKREMKMKNKDKNKELQNTGAENKKQDEKNPISYPAYFSKKIVSVAADIDAIIDSLPDDNLLSPDLQSLSLETLEEYNLKLGDELKQVVLQGEALLKKVRKASNFLSSNYLKIVIMDCSDEQTED